MASISLDQLDRLQSQLLTSGLQQKNLPLWQVIDQLIKAVRKGLLDTNANIDAIQNNVNSITQKLIIQQLLGDGDGGGDDGGSIPGTQGIPGPTGNTGPLGPMGAIIFPPDAEDGEQFPPIIGPQGNPGPTGSQGPTGPMWVPYDGIDGEDGRPGVTGNTGVTGSQGPMGPPGLAQDGDDAEHYLSIPNPEFFGTWTPVIGGAGGTTGQTYTSQIGIYTIKQLAKGRLIWVSFRAALSAKGTITGNVEIQGLPFLFTNAFNTNAVVPMSWTTLAVAKVFVMGLMLPGTQVISVRGNNAAAVSLATILVTADIANTTVLAGSFTYYTDD